jgi:GT2 family glycosyltransferase
MVISRRAWQVLGPLPECYFIYLEDAEYSWRAREAGLPVLYAPMAVAYHAVGAAVRRSYANARVAYWNARHRALFVRRNLRGWTRRGALGYLVVTKPGRALVEVLRGRPAVGWAVLRGTAEGLLSKDGKLEVRQATAVQDAQHGVVVDE